MRRAVTCLFALWLGSPAAANLVRNGSFEAASSGTLEAWRASGDRHVKQTLTVDRGRDGKQCARLACTEFTAVTPASHAMICQMGVPVRRGTTYRVAFWARAEAIAGEVVSIALSDTAAWANCGLEGGFVPGCEWRQYEFLFRATRDCGEKSRLQIWFGSTGTLWLDDVTFEEAEGDLYRPGQIIPSAGRENLVPNASFECGDDGWGSAEADRTAHWGGSMNRLFGEIDPSQAAHGAASLKIDLSPENRPVSFFDYYDLHRVPIQAPLAANMGFIAIEPGKPYVLSVAMKAAAPGTPALLAVRQFDGRRFEKEVEVSTEWRRHALALKPTSRWCYVLAGPDLREKPGTAAGPERATLWLDAVQLEQSPEPTPFRPREVVELGIATDKVGNVFGWDEPLRFRLTLASGADGPRQATLELSLVDFFDEEVWTDRREVSVPRAGRLERDVTIAAAPRYRGFMRFRAKMAAGDVAAERSMRLATIPVLPGDDSRFGVNHAYPWPHLLDLCRKAGLVWMRDWSCKWQEVEPEKGRFDFTEADHQIDRPLGHGLRVLAMLPFPSAHWSSSAPPDHEIARDYTSRREHVAYAPRDEGEFQNYVAATVSHYRDRVTWWQAFNEPVFTSYSLPRKFGYTAADYGRWTKAFAEAARRADPGAKVLAGMGYLSEGQILDDWKRFLDTGALDVIDAVDIHHYPRLRPPEFMEALLEKLNGLMDRHGGRKPIWLTEYGYYADDEPWSIPMSHSGFNTPLESEVLQAAYAVRWATILFAGGVDKVFYHAGTCDGINHDSLQGIFFEYAGQPHKIYAAQAVMSRLFAPTARFVKRLATGDGVRAYLFRDGECTLAVVWTTGGEPQTIRAAESLEVWDLMGRPLGSGEIAITGTPVYVLGEGLTDDEFVAACGVGSR